MIDAPIAIEFIRHNSYALVGVTIALESMGLPLPAESMLVGMAIYAASTQNVDICLVVGAAIVGAVVGDNVGYVIGRSIGYRLLGRVGRYIGITEDRIRFSQSLFQKHGGKIVFFGRFVALLRTVTALMAGASRMRWSRFLLFNALGGIAWASLVGFGAYFLGEEVNRLAGPVRVVLWIVISLVALAVAIQLHRKRRPST